MGRLEAQSFIQLQMLFQVQASAKMLDAEVVHVQIIARCHGTDPVKHIFPAGRQRQRMHHHIRFWQHLAHCLGHPHGELLRFLKSQVARQADR